MMTEAQDSTPTNLIVSNLSNSAKKKYVPTPKLSERKRALFPTNEVKIQNLIIEETDVQTLDTSTDSSLDGLEFHENENCKLIDKTNLLKNSSFLSRIEDINNDDFLLSADSSNDFEIPLQSTTQINCRIEQSPLLKLQLEPESNDSSIQQTCSKVDFHNAFKLLNNGEYSSPKSLDKCTIKFRKNNSDDSIDSNIIIPETPLKKDTPKTPYETLNTDLELPRMNNRKSLLSIFRNCTTVSTDENINEKYISNSNDSNETVQNSFENNPGENLKTNSLNNLKRKIESPESVSQSLSCPKLLKLNDKKSSKVRTSLFTKDNEDENNKEELVNNGLSPKLFYRSSVSPLKKLPLNNNASFKLSTSKAVSDEHLNKIIDRTNKSKSVYLCGRNKKTKKRNSFGEINAGVRTGIKKRKIKSKLNNSQTKSHLIKQEAFKYLNENQLKNPIWNKKSENLISPLLPSDKVTEMDNLMKQLKNSQPNNNLKRSSAVLCDTTNTDGDPVEKRKIQKIDDNNKLFKSTFPMSSISTSNKTKENSLPSKPKKFFKTKPPTFDKMNINILKNINLKVENGKVQLQTASSSKNRNNRQKINSFDTSDLNVDEVIQVHDKVDDVIKKLEETHSPELTKSLLDDDDMNSESNTNVTECNSANTTNVMLLSAHYSQIKDDNSIILHQPPQMSHEFEMQDISKATSNNNSVQKTQLLKNVSKLNKPEDIIMSPTSLMCDMTSGLALTSPKKVNNITKAENLTNKLSNCPSKSELSQDEHKLYPVFIKGQTTSAQMLALAMNKQRMTTRSRKIWKNFDEKQYQIDAGQRKWGVTQCPQCEVIYSQNEPEDEQRHLDFHNNVHYLKFNGWKNEKVVAQFNYNQERIIEIAPNDSKAWWKKVTDLLFVVDKDLGYGQRGVINTNITKIYFYVRNKQIIGFLSAIPLTSAYRMIPNSDVDCCTNTAHPVKCGISRLWVASSYRRKKIATYLVDTLRKAFLKGYCLSIDDIAFSVPGENGKNFARAYTKSEQYLVYMDQD